jgi:hypothetical protein
MKMLMRVGGVAARHDTVIANPAHSGDGGPLRAAGPDRPRPAATGRSLHSTSRARGHLPSR